MRGEKYMSHFNVWVVAETEEQAEEMLSYYDEENHRIKKEISETFEERIELALNWFKNDEREFLTTFEHLIEKGDKEKIHNYIVNHYENNFSYDYDGYYNSVYYVNPNGKWDWYAFGGRWYNSIKTKDGKTVNDALISEIDFTPKPKTVKYYSEEWDISFGLKKKDHKHFFMPRPEYLTERYGTKENYVKLMSKVAPYAVLTEYGWFEAGAMGYFGISFADKEGTKSYNEWFDKFVSDPENQNKRVFVVDCHI